MNTYDEKVKTMAFTRIILSIVTGIAGAACFIGDKLLLGAVYLGMALFFLLSLVFSVFRFRRRKVTE
ncbi:MAG: hypothetical protein IKG93_12735 [Clostridiales bacterium]|nr:hypothetical protein [Clostridiales bacterium]